MSCILGGKASLDLNSKPSICSLTSSGICSQEEEFRIMKTFLKHKKIENVDNLSNKNVLESMLKILNVKDENLIWDACNEFTKYVGNDQAEKVIKKIFKPVGPSDSTDLLDNFNIDECLEQWENNSVALFKKKFKHIPFQMIDFATTGTELANLELKNLINKYDCFGVVLNTDKSSGKGKHWFCLYGDLQHSGTEQDPYQIEYFNSSGNPPMHEVEVWMNKAVYDLKKDTKKICKIVRSIPTRIQYSNTECGVFSLIYILSRLENKPTNWFYITNAGDPEMIRYRQQLFRKN